MNEDLFPIEHGIFQCHAGFQGCNNPGGDWHAGWLLDPDHASKKLSLFDQTSDPFKRFPLTKDDEIAYP